MPQTLEEKRARRSETLKKYRQRNKTQRSEYLKQWRKANPEKSREHGRRYYQKNPLYNTWASMRGRCLNSSNPFYCNYGGRGIAIYPPWITDYKAYEAYILGTLGPKPSASHTIDRIDNEGHYEPGNLRWANWSEQHSNKRRRNTRKVLH